MYKTKKGLWGLLLLGGLVLLLAAMGSGAWAAPNQSPLRQTIPVPFTIHGFLCDNNDGVPGCQFPAMLREGALSSAADTPIQNELVTLSNGSPPPPTYTDADGYYKFEGLAAGSAWVVTALGFSQPVTIGADGEGVVQDFYPGMEPVGGYALSVNKFELLAPWIGLAALMGVVGAAVVLGRRGQG